MAATIAAMSQRRQRESRAAPSKAHSVAAKSECPEISVDGAAAEARNTEQHEESMKISPVSADKFHRKLRLKHRERVVFKTEDLSEAEIQAIVQGNMDAGHDHLNAELDQDIGSPLSR